MAAENPEAIIYEPIDIKQGLTKEQAKKVAQAIGVGAAHEEKTIQLLENMYKLFVQKDALLIEINPYAEDAMDGCKLLISCKFNSLLNLCLP